MLPSLSETEDGSELQACYGLRGSRGGLEYCGVFLEGVHPKLEQCKPELNKLLFLIVISFLLALFV